MINNKTKLIYINNTLKIIYNLLVNLLLKNIKEKNKHILK